MHERFKVRNINGTSAERYAKSASKSEESWLEVWRVATRSERTTCCVLRCSRTDLVGGHVMSCDLRMSRQWYLVPICRAHNHVSNKDEMWLDERVTLVPVAE
jgi:hypothetical protein